MKATVSSDSVRRVSGGSHPLLLAGSSLIIGAALTAAWFHYHDVKISGFDENLAPASRDSLQHLAAPVDIQFYSVLPASSADPELLAFSSRVEHLLEDVRDAGGGKIQITRIDASVSTNADAAAASGLQAFNLNKGDACFLGATISSGDHKEAIARFQPEWAPALQYDLVRAILRVAVAPPAPPAAAVVAPSAEIVSSVSRLVPDVSAISVADADQIFHAEFLKDCATVGSEMEAEVTAAQQQVSQAQNGGSPADLAAAQKHLLDVQMQQVEKMKQIAADLQTRLAVFQQMKAAATNSAAK